MLYNNRVKNWKIYTVCRIFWRKIKYLNHAYRNGKGPTEEDSLNTVDIMVPKSILSDQQISTLSKNLYDLFNSNQKVLTKIVFQILKIKTKPLPQLKTSLND